MSLLDVDAFGKTADDYKKVNNEKFEETCKIVRAANPDIQAILIGTSGFSSEGNLEESQELRESKRQLKSFIEASKFPHDYDGHFTIHADGELIYEVLHGRITKDNLGLALEFQCENEFEKKFDTYLRYSQGQEVLEEIKKFTEAGGTRQDDNSVFLKGDCYTFYLNKDQLKVSYKDADMEEKMEILNNDGYTPYAASRDMIFMNKIKQKMEGFEQLWKPEEESLKPKI